MMHRSFNPGHWISHGESEIVINGTEVQCKLSPDHHGDNKFNTMWKEDTEGVSSGTHYWKIHFTGNAPPQVVFVGLTDLEHFDEGYGLRGLMYGGNLSNGGSLVTASFGPRIKDGNVVGLLAIFESDKLKIYFDIDGSPLGLAYDLPGNVLKGAFPVVSFGGNGKANITKSGEIPQKRDREEPIYEGIEGDWKCFEFGGKPFEKSATVKISKHAEEENNFHTTLRVVNTINFTLIWDPTTNTWSSRGSSSTLIGASEEMMKLEKQFSIMVQNPSKLEVEGEELIIENGGLTSRWKRYSTAKPPCTQNPL